AYCSIFKLQNTLIQTLEVFPHPLLFTPALPETLSLQTQSPYHAHKAGLLALKELSQPRNAVVIGTTSRGIYLRTSERRVIFLSSEPFCSPWTVLLKETLANHEDISPGTPIEVTPGWIRIPSGSITVNLSQAEVWLPPLPSASDGNPKGWIDRLRSLAQKSLEDNGELGFARLLPPILSFPPAPLTAELQLVWEHIQHVSSGISARDQQAVTVQLMELMGLGRGLTPSGDDFIAGLLLVYNRWMSAVSAPFDLISFNRDLTEAAYRKTTTLSANIIESAVQGIGDERILLALDGIMTGIPDENSCFRFLTRYGSSSGVDTLAGIATAICANPPR
ncbi:MAG: DUF2877 domain-containing protein, partial [Anaerolineaceae bacterium]|nr:DUF2877 domain-containing protein [Anaerolineaceae bacterium]